MHRFGWLSGIGENFANLLQKDGVSKKGGSLRKGEVPNMEETMNTK